MRSEVTVSLQANMSKHAFKYLEDVHKMRESAKLTSGFFNDCSNHVMDLLSSNKISCHDGVMILKLISNDQTAYIKDFEEKLKCVPSKEEKEKEKVVRSESIVDGTHYFHETIYYDNDEVLGKNKWWKIRRTFTKKQQLTNYYPVDKQMPFPAVTEFYPNGNIKLVMFFESGIQKNMSDVDIEFDGNLHIVKKPGNSLPSVIKYAENGKIEYIENDVQIEKTTIYAFSRSSATRFDTNMTRDTTYSQKIYYGDGYDIHYNCGYQSNNNNYLRWYRIFYDSGYIIDQYYYNIYKSDSDRALFYSILSDDSKGFSKFKEVCTIRYSILDDENNIVLSTKKEHQPSFYRVFSKDSSFFEDTEDDITGDSLYSILMDKSVMEPQDTQYLTYKYMNEDGHLWRQICDGPAIFEVKQSTIEYIGKFRFDRDGRNHQLKAIIREQDVLREKGLFLKDPPIIVDEFGNNPHPPKHIVDHWNKIMKENSEFKLY